MSETSSSKRPFMRYAAVAALAVAGVAAEGLHVMNQHHAVGALQPSHATMDIQQSAKPSAAKSTAPVAVTAPTEVAVWMPGAHPFYAGVDEAGKNWSHLEVILSGPENTHITANIILDKHEGKPSTLKVSACADDVTCFPGTSYVYDPAIRSVSSENSFDPDGTVAPKTPMTRRPELNEKFERLYQAMLADDTGMNGKISDEILKAARDAIAMPKPESDSSALVAPAQAVGTRAIKSTRQMS